MAKDVNIHIKATGGAEAKQQLEGVADAAQKTGSGVQDMGTKALIGSGWVQKALSFLAGPLGFAGIAGAVAGGAIKIAQFFDDIKTRSDEAVQHVQQIRASFAELFEVMDAYSEKSRQALTLETTALLQRTAVTQQMGLPVITAYARRFQPFLNRGEITQPQYRQGLEQMLRYAGRQGAGAVPEMLDIMAGWQPAMVTPEKQGAFSRMVTEAAQTSGLTKEDIVGAMRMSMPTIKAMGWTPEETLIAVATLAQSKKPRHIPTTLQALMGGEIPKELQKQIPKELGGKPRELFAYVKSLQGKMPQQGYLDLLTKLYGAEAATGVLELTAGPPRGLPEAITEAAGPAGASREAQQEKERQETMAATAAKVESSGRYRRLETIREEKEMGARLRELGQAEREIEEHPVQQFFRNLSAIGANTEKERAAFARWTETLTPEEKQVIFEQYITVRGQEIPRKFQKVEAYQRGIFAKSAAQQALYWQWKQMTAKEKIGALLEHTEEPPTPTVIYNDSHDFIVNPVVGNKADLMGPRTSKGIH